MDLPVTTPPMFRSNNISKDAKMQNCFKETSGGKVQLVKRPGKNIYEVSPALDPLGKGLWTYKNGLYAVANNSLYNIDGNISTLIGSLSGSGENISWCNTGALSSPAPYMVLHDMMSGYVLDATGTFTQITSAGFPANPVHGIVYLDGYVFVMDEFAQVWQSDQEDPLTWGALNFLTVKGEPDKGVAIAKHFNYLVAFKEWTTEFLYDNANSTGSVLSINMPARIEIGCADGHSVVQLEETVIWMGHVKEGGRNVTMLEALRPVNISTGPIEHFLNASDLSQTYSWAFKMAGHTFYGLVLTDQDVTMVYDLKEKEWHLWTTSKAFIGGGEGYFECTFVQELDNVIYVLDAITANTYILDQANYEDPFGPITVRYVSPRYDFGTRNRKFNGMLTIYGNNIDDTLQVRHTNDDYTTWSTYRDVDLSLNKPCLYKLGSFIRRAYEILYIGDNPLELEKMELEVSGVPSATTGTQA